jgi:hypothetical protein
MWTRLWSCTTPLRDRRCRWSQFRSHLPGGSQFGALPGLPRIEIDFISALQVVTIVRLNPPQPMFRGGEAGGECRSPLLAIILISISYHEYWSEWRDSNPRPLVPQTSALTGLRYTPTPALIEKAPERRNARAVAGLPPERETIGFYNHGAGFRAVRGLSPACSLKDLLAFGEFSQGRP